MIERSNPSNAVRPTVEPFAWAVVSIDTGEALRRPELSKGSAEHARACLLEPDEWEVVPLYRATRPAEAREPVSCNCKRSDAWRCAVERNLTSVACGCACHHAHKIAAAAPQTADAREPDGAISAGAAALLREGQTALIWPQAAAGDHDLPVWIGTPPLAAAAPQAERELRGRVDEPQASA